MLLHIRPKGLASLTDEVTTLWIDFVNAVSTKGSNQQKQNLFDLVAALKQLDVLPMWINSLFAHEVKRGEPLVFLEQTHAEFMRASKILETISEKRQALIDYDLSVWDEPRNFGKNRENFRTRFSEFFTSDAFLSAPSKLEQMAAAYVMALFVDTFDQSIKTLKGSPSYANVSDKVHDFKVRLSDYFELLLRWAPQYKGHFLHAARYFLEQFPETEAQLFPSGQARADRFNIDVVDWNSQPKTLEDLFPSLHLSLNSLTGKRSQLALSTPIVLPADLSNFLSELMNIKFVGAPDKWGKPIATKAKITSIWVSQGVVNYQIGISLREHAEQIALNFDKADGSIDITFGLVGGNERFRWDLIRDFLTTFSFLHGYSYEDESPNRDNLVFRMRNIQTLAPKQLAELQFMVFESAKRSHQEPSLLTNDWFQILGTDKARLSGFLESNALPNDIFKMELLSVLVAQGYGLKFASDLALANAAYDSNNVFGPVPETNYSDDKESSDAKYVERIFRFQMTADVRNSVIAVLEALAKRGCYLKEGETALDILKNSNKPELKSVDVPFPASSPYVGNALFTKFETRLEELEKELQSATASSNCIEAP